MKAVRIIASMLLCGSGHILKREYVSGILLLLAFLASLAVAFLGIQTFGISALILTVAGVLCALFIWIYSLVDICSNSNVKKKKSKILPGLERKGKRGITILK